MNLAQRMGRAVLWALAMSVLTVIVAAPFIESDSVRIAAMVGLGLGVVAAFATEDNPPRNAPRWFVYAYPGSGLWAWAWSSLSWDLTLVQLVVIALSAIGTLDALFGMTRRGQQVAAALAWAVTALLMPLFFAGIFVLPIAVALTVKARQPRADRRLLRVRTLCFRDSATNTRF